LFAASLSGIITLIALVGIISVLLYASGGGTISKAFEQLSSKLLGDTIKAITSPDTYLKGAGVTWVAIWLFIGAVVGIALNWGDYILDAKYGESYGRIITFWGIYIGGILVSAIMRQSGSNPIFSKYAITIIGLTLAMMVFIFLDAVVVFQVLKNIGFSGPGGEALLTLLVLIWTMIMIWVLGVIINKGGVFDFAPFPLSALDEGLIIGATAYTFFHYLKEHLI